MLANRLPPFSGPAATLFRKLTPTCWRAEPPGPGAGREFGARSDGTHVTEDNFLYFIL